MEQWKPIDGFDGAYEVSNLGRVRIAKGKVMTTEYKPSTRGLRKRVECRVSLTKDKQRKHYYVGRLVAGAFCDGYAEGLTVDHIDGDTTNNAAENLEWVTRSENIRRGRCNGSYSHNHDRLWMKGRY